MSKKMRVSGFTLAELITALILGCILVAASYTAYRYVNKSLMDYREISTDISETFRSIGIAEQEAWLCDSVTTNADTVLFHHGSITGRIYSTKDKYVISRGGYTDTLAIRNLSVQGCIRTRPSKQLNQLELKVNCGGENLDILIPFRP